MRNIVSDALILSLQQSGENNKSVLMLAKDEGIVRATLFGGAKSRLRAQISPMNTGQAWISIDSVRKIARISDFKTQKIRLSFRENLSKMIFANIMAEILIKTKAAANPQESWILANGFLDGMDFFGEDEAARGFVRFFWRYLEILGERPSVCECAKCGAGLFESGGTKKDGVSLKAAFDSREKEFVCADCAAAGNSESFYFISQNALEYLHSVEILKPKIVRQIPLSKEIFEELKHFVFFLAEIFCSSHLKSIESSAGLI